MAGADDVGELRALARMPKQDYFPVADTRVNTRRLENREARAGSKGSSCFRSKGHP